MLERVAHRCEKSRCLGSVAKIDVDRKLGDESLGRLERRRAVRRKPDTLTSARRGRGGRRHVPARHGRVNVATDVALVDAERQRDVLLTQLAAVVAEFGDRAQHGVGRERDAELGGEPTVQLSFDDGNRAACRGPEIDDDGDGGRGCHESIVDY